MLGRFVRILNTCISSMAFILLMYIGGYAQKIYYSQPERDDSRNTAFEIIGKVGQHILVYKDNNGDEAISIYDNEMNPVNRVPLRFRYNLLNVDFINYPNQFILIYQYQYRRYVYCYGMIMDENASIIGQPVLIDSTDVGFGNLKHKLYSVTYSDDKHRILVYKINQNKELTNIFYTFLLNDQLQLLNNSRVSLPMENRKDYLTGFSLDNEGNFVFVKVGKANNKDLAADAWMVTKPAYEDTFYTAAIPLNHRYIDEFKLKLDNDHHLSYAVSFFYDTRRNDVAGLCYVRYRYLDDSVDIVRFIPFDNNLKAAARNGAPREDAFDDYFLRQLILRSDGGFLITAESFYSSSGYNPWNRWDYLYGPYTLYPYYDFYYTPFSPWFYSPFYRSMGYSRFHYNDIAVLSYDGTGKLEWSNFVRKDQYDDQTDDFLSYQLLNTGLALHFLYNEPYRRSYILRDVTITPDGKLNMQPTMRGLDRGYVFMPRYGKQISANETVIPCIYRNFVCFAKIQF